MNNLFCGLRRLKLLDGSFLLGTIVYSALISLSANAQIIPDHTLGQESSVVIPNLEVKGINSDLLGGGAIRGVNLFHSFQDFNIEAGRGAYFVSPAAIVNIITRITGNNPSQILGTLGVLGNANLFFLNPQGIIFGADASLDLRGSFVGTTASSFTFADGSKFSAINPNLPPLLTVNVQQPIGLQFEGQQGIITNAADLAVTAQQTLSLSGSSVTSSGNLSAPGGKIELLGTETVVILGNGTIDVSAATGGGTVLIGGGLQGQGNVVNAKRTYVGSNVRINADALTNGNGGTVVIWADEVTGFYGSISAKGGVEWGNGGFVEVSGQEHLLFRGDVNTNAVNGLSGTLLLDPTNIMIVDGSGDQAGDGSDTFAGDNSGVVGLILSAPLSDFDDTTPTTIYESELEGLSGDTNIILQGTNNITLQNLSDNRLDFTRGEGVIVFSADADGDGVGNFVMEDQLADIIFTNGRNLTISGANLAIGNLNTIVSDGGTISAIDSGSITLNASGDINISGVLDTSGNLGNGGIVNITAKSVFLTHGAQINSSITGAGTGGAIAITAREKIELSGANSQGSASFIQSLVASGATGNSEGITINTGSLSLKDGAYLDVSTLGVGNGGAISITATDSITLEGESSQGFQSFIQSVVDLGATGNSGGITIDTRFLSLKDGASLNTSTLGLGNAGAIAITATDSITLEGENNQGFSSSIGSQVLAAAEGTSEGIIINTGSLFLKDGGLISASTLGVGNGGVITITATDKIILEGENSLGFSSAMASEVTLGAEGNAGGIMINTGSLSLKDGALIITSTRDRGDAGKIEINARGGITLEGQNSQGVNGGLYSQVQRGARGNARGITINTRSLSLIDGANISSGTFGLGDAGTISITATDTITLQGENRSGLGSLISSQANRGSTGTAGGITIETGSLTVIDGSRLTSTTFGVGDAGTISISATDAITLAGKNSRGFLSGIFSEVQLGARGNAGGITIETGWLFILNRAQISAATGSLGDAGAITINATDTIMLAGKDNLGLSSSIISGVTRQAQGNAQGIRITSNSFILTDGAFISARTIGKGKAGDIVILANNLEANKGSLLRTNTTTDFDAGDINLTIRDNLLLSGIGSGLFAQTEGAGQAGNITINTAQLTLDQGASISAFTRASGNGGTINVSATQAVLLTDDSQLTVETSSAGKPGDISLTTPNLTIGKNAEISATATQESTNTEGGGTININASYLNLTGKLGIFAATQGITPAGTLNIQPANNQPNLVIQFTDTALISASTSSRGTGGDINITAPNTINLSGSGKVTVETTGTGNAGSIKITTESLNLSEGLEISASTLSEGNAGSIILNANQHTLNNTQINSFTNGNGNAGSILINKDGNNAHNITLSNNSLISTEIQANGNADIPSNIILQTNNLNLNNNSQITASTQGKGDAGNISVTNAENINLNQSSITASTSGEGNTGLIDLNSSNTLQLNNSQINSSVVENAVGNSQQIRLNSSNINLNSSQISATTAGQGNAGNIIIPNASTINLENSTISTEIVVTGTATQASNININTQQLNLNNNSQITASTQGKGDAGNINIPNAENINLNQSSITASTASTGNAGDIILKAENNIILNNSAIEGETQPGARGDGGNINIQTSTLTLNNSQITTNSEGEDSADAGIITINSPLVDLDNNSQISATTSAGTGGNINIIGKSLNLNQSSQIRTTTSGNNNAGDINLILEDSLIAVGNNTGIFADTTINALGDSGNIFIDPPLLILTDGATISVNNLGQGIGGNIDIFAGNLTLDNGSIVAQTTSNTGGNINLNIKGILLLRNGSQISTTAGTLQAGGDGGNIKIDAKFIIAFPTENSDITANAFLGNGGNIFINLEGIFGIAFREKPTIFSDITASSQFGLAGIVDINTPENDPNQGLVTFPQQVIDTKIVLGCDANRQEAVTFYNIGRGGISHNPDHFLSADTVISEWLPLNPVFESFLVPENVNFSESSAPEQARIIQLLVPACWQ